MILFVVFMFQLRMLEGDESGNVGESGVDRLINLLREERVFRRDTTDTTLEN